MSVLAPVPYVELSVGPCGTERNFIADVQEWDGDTCIIVNTSAFPLSNLQQLLGYEVVCNHKFYGLREKESPSIKQFLRRANRARIDERPLVSQAYSALMEELALQDDLEALIASLNVEQAIQSRGFMYLPFGAGMEAW